MTVLEAIQLSTTFLERKSISSARLHAELLLAEVLHVKRFDLYLKFDQPLSQIEIDKYREFLVRRSKKEPLQYIIGHTQFYGLDFNLNNNVLIPRSDTERLVELTIAHINSLNNSENVLEVGTGSGNIAVAIAFHCPEAKIFSIDISPQAIELAKQNAQLNNVENRINFICENFSNYNFEVNKFDIIVSNPPYISTEEFKNLDSEVSDFEPRIALTDDKDGLTFFKLISKKATTLLNKEGSIFFEVGFNQADKVKEILLESGFINILVHKDYSGIDRVVQGILK